jgi:NAD(P)-dependent dehydrogenase (short-subunit alcohol dehydrogenase family)
MVATLLSLSAMTTIAQADARTVLITGSSKGHGLNFVNDYAERGWNVIATCRTPSKADELQALADQYDNVTIETLDVTDFAGVDALAAKYRGTPIDVLNLNGAINTWSFGPQKFGRMDYEWYEEILKVNIIGQLYVAEAFLEHVAASQQKTIAAMSSQGSSITNANSGTAPSYRSSKAGMNMVMRAFGEAVKGRGVIVVVIAPGTVDTEDYMNAEDPSTIPENRQRMIKMGRLAPRSAIGSMIDLINSMTIDDIRVLHQWDGEVLPW